MPKVRECCKQDGSHYGWSIYCEACETEHMFDDRWTFNGDIEKPTFRASMLSNGGGGNPYLPICHSFVTDGKIEYLSDCTHKFAGKTLDLQDFIDLDKRETVHCSECVKNETCMKVPSIVGCLHGEKVASSN